MYLFRNAHCQLVVRSIVASAGSLESYDVKLVHLPPVAMDRSLGSLDLRV